MAKTAENFAKFNENVKTKKNNTNTHFEENAMQWLH